MVLPTVAGKLAVALANGDLSKFNSIYFFSVWNEIPLLVSDVLIFDRVDTREREQFAEMIEKLNQESHEAMKSQQ